MKWTWGEARKEVPWASVFVCIHPCNRLGAGAVPLVHSAFFLMPLLRYFMGPKISSTGPASMNVLPSCPKTQRLLATSAQAAVAPSSPQPTWLAPWLLR